MVALIWSCRRAPRIILRCDRDVRIRDILFRSSYHREQLESQAVEFIELHGFDLGDDEADELFAVVYAGQDYKETKTRIQGWNSQRGNS